MQANIHPEILRNISDISAFVNQCTEADNLTVIASGKLYARFFAWSQARGAQYICSNKRFSQELLELGYQKRLSNGWKWLGLRLKP